MTFLTNPTFKLVQDINKIIPSLLILFFLSPVIAISQININQSLTWDAEPIRFRIGNENLERYTFKGAYSPAEYPTLPFFMESFPVNGNGILDVQIVRER